MKALLHLALGALLISLTGSALAQSPADAAASTRIQEKFRRMELLNYTLPVLMTQKQIKGMLPLVEKARKAEQELKTKEAAILKSLEPDCDAAIKEGTTKKMVVPPTVMKKLEIAIKGMTMARQIMSEEHVGAVLAYVKANLDASQQKVAANLIPASWLNPKEPDKVTEEERLKVWVSAMILDPLCYPLLVEMAKVAAVEPGSGGGQ